MPISNILERAKSLLGYADESQNQNESDLEDSLLYSKNNICIHEAAMVRNDCDVQHHSGYLTLCTKIFIDQHNLTKRPTLLLTWIPNSTLKKCPAALENFSPAHQAMIRNIQRSESSLSSASSRPAVSQTNPFLENYVDPDEFAKGQQTLNSSNVDNKSMNFSDYSETLSISSNSDRMSVNDCCYTNTALTACDVKINPFCVEEDEGIIDTTPEETLKEDENGSDEPIDQEEEDEIRELKSELEPLLEEEPVRTLTRQLSAPEKSSREKLLKNLKNNQSMTSVNITISNPRIENTIVSTIEETTDEVEQSLKQHNKLQRSTTVGSIDENPNFMSAEMIALRHNMTFPDSAMASPILPSKHHATDKFQKRFSVDISQMRSLRLFFSDVQCTSGQLIIASRESQYKILHFHHGGLDKLAQVLHQWHCILHNVKTKPEQELSPPYRQFMVVCRPEIKKNECHPEDGKVQKITTDYFYGNLLNDKGQLDDLQMRKCVFFGGLEKSLRKTVWPFLLHCYSANSTFNERIALAEIRAREYEEITRKRLYTMSPEQQASFWKTVQCVIEKDVVRTDRANPYFAGEGNANIEVMKNILLNYAYNNPSMSYTQGMSDLLAPVLCEIKNESETFWCFTGLMQRAIFVCTPTDNDVDKNLKYLRELIRLMLPKYYEHLMKHNDAMEMLFCHRWLLLCFKREFTEAVAIRIWEACWANYLTDYFHLFVCLAIISAYSDDVIAQDLKSDEMLLYFSSLAMYMDGKSILRKARGLLHQFRQYQKIPCSLASLCRRCGPGIWETGHRPSVECIGHEMDEKCSLDD